MNHVLNADFPPVLISGTVWLRLQFSATNAGWIIAGQAEIGYTENRFAAAVPSWGCYCWFGGTPWAGFWANLTFGGGPAAPRQPVTWVESSVPEVAPVRLSRDVSEGDDGRIRDDPALPFEGNSGSPAVRRVTASAGTAGSRSATVALQLSSSVAGQTIEPGTLVEWAIYAQVSTGDNSGLALLSADMVQDAGNPGHFDIPPATAIGALMEAFDRPAGISNPGPSGSALGGTQVGTPGSMNLEQIGGSQNTFGMEGYETGLDVYVDAGVGQSGPTLIASGSFTAPDTKGSYTFRLQNAVANVLLAVNNPPQHSPAAAATVDLSAASLTFKVAPVCKGDCNCDDVVDFDDISPFVDALVGYTPCRFENVDINSDGLINFDDISPFIEILAYGGGPCP